MPFNGSLYRLESASQPGLHPQGGLSLPHPQDGLLLPHPQDGLLLPQPQDGLSLPQPQGGLLLSQPQDGLLLPHSILQLVSNPQSKAGADFMLQFELFAELPF